MSKFVNFQEKNLKKIDYKNYFEKIYKNLLEKKINCKNNNKTIEIGRAHV